MAVTALLCVSPVQGVHVLLSSMSTLLLYYSGVGLE